MSIVPVQRVSFVGLSAQKDRLLSDLQQLGCLELIPLRTDGAAMVGGGPSSEAREALKFLLSCPQRRRQVTDDRRFDAAEVQRQASELQQRIAQLDTQRDDLLLHLEAAKPWGDFHFPALAELGNLRLWFYIVPHKEMAKVQQSGLVWQTVHGDPRHCYVVVLSATEPAAMPVPRCHVGALAPAELARRLEEVELALDDAQWQRGMLTRWCLLLARDLARLEDAAARAAAGRQTYDHDPVFALEAWAPQERVAELQRYATDNGIVFEHRPARPDEQPPTLLRNPPRVQAGEDLVNFYMTPGYATWDPSPIVFFSFALFFAMIMADAGYAALLGAALLIGWRALGRSEAGRRYRPLLAVIVTMSLAYGVIVGSYFGLAPPPGSLLGRLHWLDIGNSQLMMGLSILVGGVHLLLANLLDARRYPDWRDALASLGWASAVAGALLLAAAVAIADLAPLRWIGGAALVVGLLLVVLYTAAHEKPVKRLLYGVLGLTRVSSAFGDVLSYLRLFALGLASASLAVAFNDMAAGIRSGMPRIGLLLALLVLVLGHALNLLLAVSSGVIHGLRLNVIEFFNWGLKDEGRRFASFGRKEGS